MSMTVGLDKLEPDGEAEGDKDAGDFVTAGCRVNDARVVSVETACCIANRKSSVLDIRSIFCEFRDV